MIWLYISVIVILAIVVIVCCSIRASTLRTISDNERRLRELELMSDEQRKQYFDEKQHLQQQKPASPYAIERTMARNGKWGWTITKHGDKVNHNGTYEVWFEIHQARQLQREMEKNEGYEPTIF